MKNNGWQPVLLSKRLARKPVRVWLNGEALVLYRTDAGIACLRDMCPHRGASLSKGRIREGEIECPYHGWRFGHDGRCTAIPLLEGPVPKRGVQAFDAEESHGLVFICRDASSAGPLPLPVWDGRPSVSKILESNAVTTLADAVENVIDPIHTMFVHRGLIRGATGPTSRVRLSAGIENGELVMRYRGEERQNGLLSRLLEPERTLAVNRFRMPGMVSLEYSGKNGFNLVTTLYFTPESDMKIKGFAIMTGPRQWGLGYLKSILFLAIMRKVIRQDLAIMQDAAENWARSGRRPHANSPLDILRPLIERLIAGDTSDVPARDLLLEL